MKEEEKKKIVGDKLTRFGELTPPIMKVETTRNNLRRPMIIFDNQKSLHAPP
jgi:hypothetical protein